MITVRRVGVAVRIGFLLWVVLAPTDTAGQVLVRGQGISIDVEPLSEGVWRAEEVELLVNARRLSLRGPVEAVDVEGSRFQLMARWIGFDPTSSLLAPARVPLVQSLELGEWVEVKLKDPESTLPVATSIEFGAKESLTIKGTVTGLIRHAGGSELNVQGFLVSLDTRTDWVEEANGLFAELFGELKSDDVIGEDAGYRQIGSRVFMSGSVRPIARVEDSFSLLEGGDELLSVGEPSARLELMAALGNGVRVFAQARVRRPYELYRSEELLGEGAGETQGQLRQLYVSAPSLFGLPIGVSVGKQRVRDNREFMFDEYLDGVRVYAYPLQPLVLEASVFSPVAPLSDKFQTWTDLLVRAQWFAAEDWRASVFAVRRWDEDLLRARNVRYFGAALEGKHEFLRVWGNAALLRGEDKGRPQEAYAWDAGVALRARGLPLRPGVSVSMAQGSGDGDSDDNISNEFRQTGYEDNSSRVWGLASFRHFGEALDPELSNIEILTATFGIRTESRFSLDLAAHRYALMELTDEFANVGLAAPENVLTGDETSLGYGGDFILALRDVLPSTHFTYKLGAFLPGDAFEIETDLAWLHKLEFRIDF